MNTLPLPVNFKIKINYKCGFKMEMRLLNNDENIHSHHCFPTTLRDETAVKIEFGAHLLIIYYGCNIDLFLNRSLIVR